MADEGLCLLPVMGFRRWCFAPSLSAPQVEGGKTHFRQLTTGQLYNPEYGSNRGKGLPQAWFITD